MAEPVTRQPRSRVLVALLGAAGLVVTLPEPKDENKDARAKIFAYYRTIENTIEPIDMDPQTEKGQKYLSIEFRDPRADESCR